VRSFAPRADDSIRTDNGVKPDDSSAQLGPNMMEKISAAVMLAVCLVMLMRLMLGEKRRPTFDARALGAWVVIGAQLRRLARWRSNRRHAAEAARDAIRRARGGADVRRDGNVYHPDSFRDPRKPH
jgi:hypothetical protein